MWGRKSNRLRFFRGLRGCKNIIIDCDFGLAGNRKEGFEAECIVSCEHELVIVLDEILIDCLGVNRQLTEHGVGCEELYIIVAAHLLSELLKDGLAKSIDRLRYFHLDDDLFLMIDQQ